MQNKRILLATLNSSFFHTAFGLRYVFANLGDQQNDAKILEFTTQQTLRDIAEEILAFNPEILGLGVYIWNVAATTELVSILKKVRPELCIVLGGPEVSYETEGQTIVQLADHVICGEGEVTFKKFCETYPQPQPKILPAELPDVAQLKFPYRYYADTDIRNRVIYVEASRGCPYKCEFCLSSLDKSVRAFPLELFLSEMDQLIERGARQFKFVDRTFNLNYKTSATILNFFLEKIELGLFLHFELVPDRLPEELKEIIKRFPPGTLQFEVGVQTWNPEVAARISRRQDFQLTENNLRFLRTETNVHIHADLIAGLPGEELQSFAFGFDRLYELKPHEIQVGILKRLRGVPIARHTQDFSMTYQETAPYLVLKTGSLSFVELQGLQRFAKFWDLYGNSGNFKRTIALFDTLTEERPDRSLFWQFWDFCRFLNERHPQRHSIALLSLVESAWIYLSARADAEQVREALLKDYTHDISRDVPKFLRTKETELEKLPNSGRAKLSIPKRQALRLLTDQ